MNSVLDFAHAQGGGAANLDGHRLRRLVGSRRRPLAAWTRSSSATRRRWSCTAIRRRSRRPSNDGDAHARRRARRRRTSSSSPTCRSCRSARASPAAMTSGRRARDERRAGRQARRRRRPRGRHPAHRRLRRARDGTHRPDAAVGASARRVPRAGQERRDAAEGCVRQAHALEDLGCFAIVLECVPAELARAHHVGAARPHDRHRRRRRHRRTGARPARPLGRRHRAHARDSCAATSMASAWSTDALDEYDADVKAGRFPAPEESYS